jgi:hypothetical protein
MRAIFGERKCYRTNKRKEVQHKYDKKEELRKTNDTADIYTHFKKLNSLALYILPILPT